MSQNEVADHIGISQSTYSDWESEKTSPNIKYWSDIARTLKVQLEKLFDEETQLTPKIIPFIDMEKIDENTQNPQLQLWQELLSSKNSEIETQKKYTNLLESQIQSLYQEINRLKEELYNYQSKSNHSVS